MFHQSRRVACAVRLALAALAFYPVVAPMAAQAQVAQRSYDIPAGPLSLALARFAAESGLLLSSDARLTEGKKTAGLKGTYGVDAGLKALLAGSGLEYVQSGKAITLRSAAAVQGEQQMSEVKVSATQDEAALPASFAGGQVARGGRIGVLGNGDFMDVPVSIVSFTSEFRDNIQALSVSDMLKYSVSVQTPQAGAVPTTDVIYVRGFNVGAYDGTFDGLPGLLGRMPPVEAVERVELLLGANAFANGQPSSVGGNINIVPKRAGEEPLYRVGVNYRTKSILGATIDAGRRFGEDKALGIRVNASYADGETELEDGQRRAFSRALALDYRGDRTRLTFDYMGNDRRLPAEAWFVINPGVVVPNAESASRDFRQPWTYYKDYWDAAVVRGEWDFADKWTLSAAYGRMWNKVERLSQVSEITADDGSMQDAWGGTLGHSRQRREGDAYEVHVRGEFATGPVLHRARAGVSQYGEKSGYAANYSPVFLPFASNIYAPVDYPNPALTPPDMPSNFDSRTRNSSVFFGDEMSFMNDRLRLMLGARQVQYKSESLDPLTGAWVGDPAEKKWSPGYGALFRLQPKLSLYANRLEALDAGYRVQPPAVNAGAVLPPLPADQTEAGIKGEFGKMGFTAAVFEIDKPSYFLDPATGIEGSNGRQVNRGLELSLFGEAARGVRIYSSTTFLDPKMEKTPGGAADGKVAVSAARFMANVYTDWDIPAVPGLAVLAGGSYSGSVYNDEANTQKLKPWTRLDLGLRYTSKVLGKQTVFRTTVDNVLDKQYWVSERGTIYMAPARTLGLTMSMDL